MHHKSTSKHGIHRMHPNCALLFTSHIQVQSKGRLCPMVIQMPTWESPRLLRFLKPELADPASMQIFCKCMAMAPRCRMLPTGISWYLS